MRRANAYLFMHTCLTAALIHIYLAPEQPCNGILGMWSSVCLTGISNQLTYSWTTISALSLVILGLLSWWIRSSGLRQQGW
ncbi:unnamed protein product [Prunus brigantina]